MDKDPQALKEYLLGNLAHEPQQRLEQQLMTDDECYQELALAEDDLIDEYARNQLSSHEKARFEDHFLCSDERRQKLNFAGALKDYIETTQEPEAPEPRRRSALLWQWLRVPLRSPIPSLGTSMAAALLLLVSGGVWSIVGNLQLQSQLDAVQEEQASLSDKGQELSRQLAEERRRSGELAGELRQQQDQRAALERQLTSLHAGGSGLGLRSPGATVASFLLAPGLLRGAGDTERVIIPAGSILVQLQLDLGIDDYQSYRVALHEPEGGPIWTQSKLKGEPSGDKTVVALTLPSQLLPQGDYHFRLSGLTPADDFELVSRYHFRAMAE